MKLKYIVPPIIGTGVIYLLYILNKSFLYSSKDFDFGEPFKKEKLRIGNLEKELDKIDWESVSG